MTGRLQLDPATRKEWIKQGKLSILMSPKSSSTNFPPAETQEQIIRSYCLVGATLERADLRGKNLDNVNLTGASLRGCDLSGSSLRGAILVGADLSRACLRGSRVVSRRSVDELPSGGKLHQGPHVAHGSEACHVQECPVLRRRSAWCGHPGRRDAGRGLRRSAHGRATEHPLGHVPLVPEPAGRQAVVHPVSGV